MSKKNRPKKHKKNLKLSPAEREEIVKDLLDMGLVEMSFSYSYEYKPNMKKTVDKIIADFEKQSKKLDKIFNCGTSFDRDFIVRSHAQCPYWVEKFFAQFDWRHIAPTYAEAVQKVLDAIKTARNGVFHNLYTYPLINKCLRQTTQAKRGFAKIAEKQSGNKIVATPAQLGPRHRGRSVYDARKIMDTNEFGLGSFPTGLILLTHPERLQDLNNLRIDCAGDESDHPDSDVRFDAAPYFGFRFGFGDVSFSTKYITITNARCGSASGFIPNL